MMLLLHAALASPLLVSAETTLPAGDLAVQVAEVDCPAGYVALSGAASIYGQITGVALLTSSPADSWETPTSWRVILARDPAAAGTSWGVQGSVRCLRASADAQVQRALVVASLPAGGGGEVTALCPAGTSVLAGGVEVTGVVDGRGIAASAPVATQGWRAEVVELDPAAPSTDRVDVAVGAWCLDRKSVV